MGVAPLVMSESWVIGGRVQGTLTRSGQDIKRIARLREYAMNTPESREEIIKVLEECAQRNRGTRKGRAAYSAISMIITVSMLEVLQGDV